MAQEKEIKIQLNIPQEEFINRITAFGFKRQKTVQQEDIYFDTPDWFLYKHVAALRLRKVNGCDHSFAFKKVFCLPGKKLKYYVEELEVALPVIRKAMADVQQIVQRVDLSLDGWQLKGGDSIMSWLQEQGWQSDQHMFKIRTVYTHEDNEIVVDDVEHVGVIIELECRHLDPHDLVKQFLRPAEWSQNLEGTSYAWLSAVKGLHDHHSALARFKIQPDWNVWSHERSWYDGLSL